MIRGGILVMNWTIKSLMLLAASMFVWVGCNYGPDEPDPVDVNIEMPDMGDDDDSDGGE